MKDLNHNLAHTNKGQNQKQLQNKKGKEPEFRGGCQILGYRLWGAILYSLRDAKRGHHQLRIAMQIKIPLIPWGKGHKRKVQTHQQRAII